MLDDFREWLSDNLRYILLGLAGLVLLLLIIGVIRLVSGGSKKKNDPETPATNKVETVTEAEADQNAKTPETSAAPANTQTQTQNTQNVELVKDDAAVLTLMKEYYNAVASGDTTTLSKIVEPWNSDVEAEVMGNTMIESYNNISTYSQDGPEEGSYVAFVYYEGKMEGIETLAPSLVRYYLRSNDASDLVIVHGGVEENKEWVAQLTNQSAVKELIADVQAKLKAAREADSELDEFLSSAAPEGSDSSKQESSGGSGKDMISNGELNIRQSPSTDASIMGVVTTGSTVHVLEDAGDGWVHITYTTDTGDVEGYVRLEYLSDAQ
ncbi:MAG: SH3 domain-containing protein [Lachnospiraceae bacterium]|nr:SH3 domain-containing protein [Lachnospiraceae bacterium]